MCENSRFNDRRKSIGECKASSVFAWVAKVGGKGGAARKTEFEEKKFKKFKQICSSLTYKDNEKYDRTKGSSAQQQDA